jgi:hypothetical protein
MVKWVVSNELGRIWKETRRPSLRERTNENRKKTVMVVVPSENRTHHLTNTSQKLEPTWSFGMCRTFRGNLLPPSSTWKSDNLICCYFRFQIVLAVVIAAAVAAPTPGGLLHAPAVAYAAPAIHAAPVALAAPVLAAPVVKAYAAPLVAAPVVKAYGPSVAYHGLYGGHYF